MESRILQALIATTKVPNDVEQFINTIKTWAEDAGLKVEAMKGCDVVECYNLRVRISGRNEEARVEFAEALTRALGPISRWTRTKDEFEGFVLDDLG